MLAAVEGELEVVDMLVSEGHASLTVKDNVSHFVGLVVCSFNLLVGLLCDQGWRYSVNLCCRRRL
jgi:hypothetical protein